MNLKLILIDSIKRTISQVLNRGVYYAIKGIAVLLILLVGWIISKIIQSLVVRILKLVKVDEVASNINLDEILKKGGITLTLSELIGRIVYWVGILVTIMIGLNALGLSVAADLLKTVVLYIPNILVAIFILIIGILLATILKNITKTAAINAGISQAKFLSNFVKAIVIIFTVLLAIQQLNIGVATINLIITIFLATLGLGIALAFGLGCKDIVAKYVKDWIESWNK